MIVPILPLDCKPSGTVLDSSTARAEGAALPLDQRPCLFLPNGRTGISIALSGLNLKPSDEVFITNSSGQTYVSSCVTCIVFNFCQPSRVLTDATRAIIVIHEYGVPHPNLHGLLAEGRVRNIPVIEDCAHTMDSTSNGQPVGSFGDYTVYSLPKLFPMRCGGVLMGHEGQNVSLNSVELAQAQQSQQEFAAQRHLLPWLSRRRKENFLALVELFKGSQLLFAGSPEITPYFFGVYLQDAWRIRQFSHSIEWGSTLRDDLLLIPTNPLVSTTDLVQAVYGALDEYARA